MDVWHDVLAIHKDGSAFGRTQRDVQHGAIFCEVDFLAAEHGVDSLAHAGLRRQLQQELEGFVGNSVLRVIEEQARRFGGQTLTTFRIIGEEFPQRQLLKLLVMGDERLPGFTPSKWLDGRFHICDAFVSFLGLNWFRVR